MTYKCKIELFTLKTKKSNNIKLPKRNKMEDKKKIKFDKKRKYQQVSGIKPDGFWYACYDDWYNFEQRGDSKYIHQININSGVLTNIQNKNKDKLLVIHNLKDFDIFNSRYAHGLRYSNDSEKEIFKYNDLQNYLVDWKKVSQDYGGIQICPYLKKRKKILWYNSFDVASGCVWNIKSIIKNSDLIYEKKNGKYVKVSA